MYKLFVAPCQIRSRNGNSSESVFSAKTQLNNTQFRTSKLTYDVQLGVLGDGGGDYPGNAEFWALPGENQASDVGSKF